MTDRGLYQDTVSRLLSGLGTQTGVAFLEHLVISLCDVFGADSAFVGLVDEDDPSRLHTVALCHNGQIVEDISCNLADTPCAEVISGAAVSIRSRLQKRFPDTELFREFGAESYTGIPLSSPDSNIIGLVALLSGKQIANDELVIEMVQVFADRIVAEIERIHHESDLQLVQQQLEKRIELAAEELNRANKELAAFSYSVSHDLRAPLRSIVGFGEALTEDCAAQLDDTAKGYLSRISRNAQQMGELIDGLLMLSRVTRQPIKRCPVNLSEQAEEILRQLQTDHPQREVSLSVQSDIIASGDPSLLRIVMKNLLTNAWTFTGRTESARISFSTYVENGNTVYQVKDNGSGFKMDYAEKLFEVFQRLHRKEDFEGIGVGLATVKRIIDRHGGSIWAEGKEGEGASFYFTLPAEHPMKQPG